jgi:hypothetical protein
LRVEAQIEEEPKRRPSMTRPFMALVATVAVASSAFAGDGGKIPWSKDPDAAFKEAKKSGKELMLYFTMPG